MPTIEIVSIDAVELGLKEDDFKMVILEEKKPISHRGLFNNYLTKKKE